MTSTSYLEVISTWNQNEAWKFLIGTVLAEISSRMEVEYNPRGEADKLSYGKVTSSGVRCSIFAIGVLTLTLVVLSGVVFSISIKAREKSQVVVYKTVAQSNDSRYQGHIRREEAKDEEHIEVVGDGYRYLRLASGSRLCHWKLSTKTGHVRLRYHTFIVMQVPGLYNVYGQYAVYKPSEENKRTQTVSVALMQNWTEISTSMVEHCKHLCTTSFSKTISVQKGDHLSLQSTTGGVFFLNSKLTFFGVNKV